jgi:hypothetical protein
VCLTVLCVPFCLIVMYVVSLFSMLSYCLVCLYFVLYGCFFYFFCSLLLYCMSCFIVFFLSSVCVF